MAGNSTALERVQRYGSEEHSQEAGPGPEGGAAVFPGTYRRPAPPVRGYMDRCSSFKRAGANY
jgi:hypothetical protein